MSGITLSLFDEAGRNRLFETLDVARRQGSRVAFDTNFRPRGWPDLNAARAVYDRMFSRSDIVLASVEDNMLLHGSAEAADLIARLQAAHVPEMVVKLAKPACQVIVAGADVLVQAEPVGKIVDTTAAGDSFAAAYIAARRAGASPEGRSRRSSPRRRGRPPSRCDHSPFRHATHQFRLGGSMSASNQGASGQSVAELLRAARLVAVLTIERLDRAVPLAQALVAGGVRTLEITLAPRPGRTRPRRSRTQVPGAIVGLGTVLTRRDLELTQRLSCPSPLAPVQRPNCSTPPPRWACRSCRGSAQHQN